MFTLLFYKEHEKDKKKQKLTGTKKGKIGKWVEKKERKEKKG